MYREDTIAAIATPPGEGGVAIVRLSGVDAEKIASRIFKPSSGRASYLETHKLYFGEIRDARESRVIDQVLLTIMRRPRSYTGEDVVEIHCHGGSLIVRQVLGLVFREGARQAEPEEFTKQAFLNGRLDLTQAEAVLDLTRARTDKAAGLALDQASGALSQWVSALREELLNILVQVEAAIDFPEEEIELLQRRQLVEKIDCLSSKINDISSTYNWGKFFREGARVCICGRPNVGKSSLLNALLGEDRVIVTPIPGTTRDVIEEGITLDGLAIVLWDTAGIRESADEVERAGINLTHQYLQKADAVLMVIDGSEGLLTDDENLLTELREKNLLIAINKSDLPSRLDGHLSGVSDTYRHVQFISAKTGYGIPELKGLLRDVLLETEVHAPVVITNERHRSALQRGCVTLNSAAKALADRLPPEFVAVELQETRKALEEIVGIIQDDEVLERIFADFCIGK